MISHQLMNYILYTNNMHKNIANRSREISAMKSVIILKKFFILPL